MPHAFMCPGSLTKAPGLAVAWAVNQLKAVSVLEAHSESSMAVTIQALWN